MIERPLFVRRDFSVRKKSHQVDWETSLSSSGGLSERLSPSEAGSNSFSLASYGGNARGTDFSGSEGGIVGRHFSVKKNVVGSLGKIVHRVAWVILRNIHHRKHLRILSPCGVTGKCKKDGISPTFRGFGFFSLTGLRFRLAFLEFSTESHSANWRLFLIESRFD